LPWMTESIQGSNGFSCILQ